jgi:Tol biopolymer transport system component
VIAALDGSEQPSNLVLINLDNGQAEILTRDAEQRVSPVWSPDGDFIAYATPSAVILRVLQTGQEVTLARVAVASLQWVSTPRQQLGQP